MKLAFLLCALLAPVPAWADIAFANLGTSANPDINSGTDASSYANSSWTPPTSGLILVCVGHRAVSGGGGVEPTISGNDLTWTAIATQTGTADTRVTLFGADATGSSAGVTTVAFAGNTQRYTVASFFHATGVDLSGGVLAAFVQAPTATGTGQPSVTLAAAGNAANRPIGCFTGNAATTTPRADWDEADDMHVETAFNIETQWRDDAFETTADATFSATNGYRAIAAELKAELTAASKPRQAIIIQ